MKAVTQYCSNEIRLSNNEGQLFDQLDSQIDFLKDLVENLYGSRTILGQISSSAILVKEAKCLLILLNKIRIEFGEKKKFSKIEDDFEVALYQTNRILSLFDKPNDFIVQKIQDGFKDSLKDNFQVSKLSDLKNFNAQEKDLPSFDFGDLGSIKVMDENVAFKLNSSGIDLFQNMNNIVYLESPIYWRIRGPLELIRNRSSIFTLSRQKKQGTLSGVPKHFYDLVDLLNERIKFNSIPCIYDDIREKLNEAIGGEIIISSSGELTYKDNSSSKEINLHSTATGITNLGIIGLLLERNVISKGSYVFIDEPEVNLHPAWQKIMIDSLYSLSTRGINIVIASHSIDMMKCIEGIVENLSEEDAQQHFGINQLNTDGTSFDGGESPLKRLAYIKEDLGSTFYEMQISGAGSIWM